MMGLKYMQKHLGASPVFACSAGFASPGDVKVRAVRALANEQHALDESPCSASLWRLQGDSLVTHSWF